MRVLFIVLLLSILSHPIQAQETSTSLGETAPALAAKPAPAKAGGDTRIEVDEQKNVIRFFIDGKQRAILDADGLHVRDNIDYGGQLVDKGRASFDRSAAESRGGSDAE